MQREREDPRVHLRERTFAKKKPANATSTRMPSYIAFPRIRPINRYQLRLWAGKIGSKVSTTTMRNSANVPSVAYACGFGYSSFFLFSNQRPRSVSNTSLHNEVKNSLKTPPPSIPALKTTQNPLDDNRQGRH